MLHSVAESPPCAYRNVWGCLWPLALAGLCLLTPLCASSETYYVAPAGSDGNPGTAAAPFQSLARSLTALRAGDTLYLRGGVYGEKLVVEPGRLANGTSSAPITIASFPGEEAIATGGWAWSTYGGGILEHHVIDRITFDGGGFFFGGAGTQFIRLQNGEVRNAPQSGVFGYGGGTNNALINMRIHDNGHSWLDHGVYALLPNFLIEGCQFYHNSGYGIQIYDTTPGMTGDGTIMRNSQIYDNCWAPGGCGNVTISHGANIQFHNNRVWGHTQGVAVSYGEGRLRNTQVRCNTIEGVIDVGVAASATVVERNKTSSPITDYGQGSIIRDNGPSMPGADDTSCGGTAPPPVVVRTLPAPQNFQVAVGQ